MYPFSFLLSPQLAVSLLSSTFSVVHCVIAQDAPRCYFPDGVTLSPDTPCTNNTASACCGQQLDGSPAYCLSNGLCLGSGTLSRGSCTDKTWTSPECPQYCKDDFIKSGDAIINCAGTNFSCMNSDGSNNCQSSIATDIFQFPHIQIVLTDAQKLTDNVSSSATATVTISPSSSTTCAPALGAGTVTSGEIQDCHTTAVGTGVGIPLGIAFVAALGLWAWERRKRQTLLAEMSSQSDEFIQMMGSKQRGDWKE